ncbi:MULTISPECIES: hypothetical protein [Psychrobacillus]|uniref:Uncharacterized protein n=1 Tax=Psychrobacillus faecigallinarum TaxID=2762235 RepID=A0ABR8RCW6_9BACI|nr:MULTISPECIES: hypothetical protein [Psychrobacillus]MBD7945632.1 hypothetical protein [Psychrobacillus faecigallinarum]
MNNWIYILYFIVLGVVSFFTGEIVTFVMLGFIIISLTNIHNTLKEILHKKKTEDY